MTCVLPTLPTHNTTRVTVRLRVTASVADTGAESDQVGATDAEQSENVS